MADPAGVVAGVACIVAVSPLIPLADGPFWRKLVTITAAFLAGRCFIAAVDGDDRWGLAAMAAALATVSLINFLTWRRARS